MAVYLIRHVNCSDHQQRQTDVEKGLISVSSPVARSLMGKMLGDVAVVITPGGKSTYEILNIKYI